MLNTVLMDVILPAGGNISSKSKPFFCWKPFTTMWALYLGGFPLSPSFSMYTDLFRSAFFPFGNSVSSYLWFSCKDSISSCLHYTTLCCGYLSWLLQSFLAPLLQSAIYVLYPETDMVLFFASRDTFFH